jgi:zinc transporter ZupT
LTVVKMIQTFSQMGPIQQALLATCFTWFMTALGALQSLHLKASTGKYWTQCWVSRRRDDRSQLLVAAGAGDRDGRGAASPLGPRNGWIPARRRILGCRPHYPTPSPVFSDAGSGRDQDGLAAQHLLVLAITLHNIP